MKKLSIILYILISGWVVTSCSEILDVTPTSVITTSSFWRTEDSAVGALNGMYVDLRSMSEAIYVDGEQRSEVFEGGVYGSGGHNLFVNDLSGDQPNHSDWRGFYRIINSANLLLKYVPGIPFKSEMSKNSILAQAYTMRAFVYFVMTKTRGDLILRTEPTESSSEKSTLSGCNYRDQYHKTTCLWYRLFITCLCKRYYSTK